MGNESSVWAWVAVATLAAGMTTPHEARAVCSVLDPGPCTPGVGSVLSRQPFTPYYCGIYSGPNCTPSEPLDRHHPVSRIDELGLLLSKCLELPPDEEARTGMRVTLKLAFRRDGDILAEPRFTYVTHEASEEVKTAYRQAALDMLKRCAPLPITKGLGGAIAARPFVIAFVEARNEKDAVEDKPSSKANAENRRR